MKKIFLGIICLLTVFGSHAQMDRMPTQNDERVKWNFYIKKDSVTQASTFFAKAKIDSGWHIFTQTPGGDGSLIPTTLQFDNKELNKNTKVIGKKIDKDMEEFGKVQYYEQVLIFETPIPFKRKIKLVKGIIEFQTCNDIMCLAPQQVPFEINL